MINKDLFLRIKILDKIYYPLLCVFIIISIFTFNSCEDIIDLDLKKAPSSIVIEAIITTENGPYFVKITKPTDYYLPSVYQTIDDAIITISDNIGTLDTLTFIQDGLYQTNNIIGVEGNTYSLAVSHNNELYTAETTMPFQVELDSLSYKKDIHAEHEGYMIFCNFQDPPDDNYYRIIIYQNGELYSEEGREIILWDDKYFNGNYVSLPIKRGGERFEANNHFKIELITLNKESYDYLNTLSNAIGGSSMGAVGRNLLIGEPSPSNPISNISNDALGYFSTYCIVSDSILIEE